MIITAILLATLHTAAHGQGSCKLTLQTDFDHKKEPLVLDVNTIRVGGKETEELRPVYPQVEGDKGVVTVENEGKLKLACTGKNNINAGSGSSETYLECKGGSLLLEGRRADKKSISCSRHFAGSEITVTDKKCGPRDCGTVLVMGFKLDDGSWFPMVDLCHDMEKQVTLYARHTLEGASLMGAERVSDRRKFVRGNKELFSRNNPDFRFSRNGQLAAFKEILGESAKSIYLSDSQSFLARGHLAPDADFIYNSGQMLTYYYANAAPQWQKFNAGNWLVIENAVRDLANKEQLSLEIYTGTHGVLRLPDESGKYQEVYLDFEANPKRIPIPFVFWKIVQHPVTNDCTVVVGHNNVNLDKPPKPICRTVKPAGWPDVSDLAKGYTYYCDYNSFAKAVANAPKIRCKGLHGFPLISN